MSENSRRTFLRNSVLLGMSVGVQAKAGILDEILQQQEALQPKTSNLDDFLKNSKKVAGPMDNFCWDKKGEFLEGCCAPSGLCYEKK